MKSFKFIQKPALASLFVLVFTAIYAQIDTVSPGPGKDQLDAINSFQASFVAKARGSNGARIMFYNTENFYDTVDDPTINDEDFLPDGANHWDMKRYEEKLNHIYQTITAVGGWESPDLVGFAEVENRAVLEDLLHKTPLEKENYAIVHENSADLRGIDVALLYKPSKFKYISHYTIRPTFPNDTSKTRDILCVKGIFGKDTLHVFVAHLPSRRGGTKASEPRRVYVAGLIRKAVDDLYAANPQANIVVMGDFNDEYDDKSISETLSAKSDAAAVGAKDMYAFMGVLAKNWKLGSEKYKEHWGIIDHIICSSGMLKRQSEGMRTDASGAHIYAGKFLLTEDHKYQGFQPFRTYGGPKYLGGYSDHLPVYVDIWW